MDGLTLLEQARSAGLTVIVQDDKLVICGPRRAGHLAEQLLARKGEIIDALTVQSLTPGDLPGDWRVFWEERAAVREYDGHLTREIAEILALADTAGCMRQTGNFS